jgi:hypothetical protein
MKRRVFVAAGGAAAGASLGAGHASATVQPGPQVAYRGRWAGRPVAGTVLAGTEIAITDVPAGRVTRWTSEGGQWVPSNGRVVLYTGAKGYTDPLGSLTWNSAAITMAIPGGSIALPAGLIVPGQTELRVSVLWATGPNVGGIGAQMTLGISNSWSDTQCSGAFIGPNNEWDQVASFTFPTATTMSQASSRTPKNGTPAGQIGSEHALNINTAADMYINFGTTAGGAFGNVLKIVRVLVELFP